MYFTNKEKFFRYPGRLACLAMDAVGEYVSSLLKILTVNDHHHHLVEELCKHLQDMLHSTMPRDLEEELRIRVLRKFENAYQRLIDDYTFDKNHEIATDIFIAIVHPSTTIIECYNQSSHPGLLDGYRMRFSDLVYSALPKLKYLKVLRLGEAYYINNRNELNIDDVTENLEEFRSELSSNMEIMTLAQCSRKLKILDFADSLDVYNESIPSILELECLEELDTHYSMIDTEGFKQLLTQLIHTKRPCGRFASELIQRFSCDGLSEEEIQIIANKFRNLKSLTVKRAIYDLAPLRVLKCLKHLEIKVEYHLLQGLLSSIGNQLVCLELRNVFDVNLQHVASCCTSLCCLHLQNSPLVENIDFTKMNENSKFHKAFAMPEFPKVSCLELDFSGDNGTFTQYVMSRFKNVRKLLLSHCENNMLFDAIIQRKVMKNIEVVFFRNSGGFVTLQIFEKYAVITDFPYRLTENSVITRSVSL